MKLANEVLLQELDRVAAANGGRLTPDAVVADARDNKDSKLSALFDFDDVAAAAHQHWLNQARQIIRSVQYEYRTETRTVNAPAYVRDPDMAGDEQGYASVRILRTDADRAREALLYEFGRAASLLQRARDLAVVFELQDEVDVIAQHVERVSALVRGRGEGGAAVN